MFDDYFFVAPSALSGAARVLDLGGVTDSGSYVISDTPDEADARALASDWALVGADMMRAQERFAAEHAEELARAHGAETA